MAGIETKKLIAPSTSEARNNLSNMVMECGLIETPYDDPPGNASSDESTARVILRKRNQRSGMKSSPISAAGALCVSRPTDT